MLKHSLILLISIFISSCLTDEKSSSSFTECLCKEDIEHNKKEIQHKILAYEKYLTSVHILDENKNYLNIYKDIHAGNFIPKLDLDSLNSFKEYAKINEETYQKCKREFYNSMEYKTSKLVLIKAKISSHLNEKNSKSISASEVADIILNTLENEDFENVTYKLNFFFLLDNVIKPNATRELKNKTTGLELFIEMNTNGITLNNKRITTDSLLNIISSKNVDYIYLKLDKKLLFEDFNRNYQSIQDKIDSLNKNHSKDVKLNLVD